MTAPRAEALFKTKRGNRHGVLQYTNLMLLARNYEFPSY
jgi:hypothetical protein